MTRHLSIVAGFIVLYAAWFGPLPLLAGAPFAAHMIVHISVVGVAAPLIGAWLASSRVPMNRILQPLFSPIPASVFEFIVIWAWHTPMLHELSRLSRSAYVAEQFSFVIAGILLWTSALRRGPLAAANSGAGVIALLLTSMHMILLGTLLTLAPRPFYTHAIASVGDVYAQLAGQRIGGMLMLLGGGLPYLAGGLYLVNRLLHEPQPGAAPVRRSPLGDPR